MQAFSLNAIPSQSFSTTQDGDNYVIRIKECNGCMAADITRNGTVLLSGKRINSGTPLIPFVSYEAQAGNFIFICSTEDIVYYDQFGVTQTLYYLSNAEMVALRL